MKSLRVLAALSLALVWAQAFALGDPAAGGKKSQVCQSCHGPDGNSANPAFPRLAGQQADYLAKALDDYKSGARKNAVMRGFAAPLSPQDMADLAAYFSNQKGLVVIPLVR
jgi:cytochrome c553